VQHRMVGVGMRKLQGEHSTYSSIGSRGHCATGGQLCGEAAVVNLAERRRVPLVLCHA
jgi:hypothetical protein